MNTRDLIGGAKDRITSVARDLPIDKAIDAACALGTGWSVIGAVRKAGSLAGSGSVRKALGMLGGSAGAVGGALNVAGIAISCYVATDQLLVEEGESVVETLLAKGVDAGEVAEVVDMLKVSAPLKKRLMERVHDYVPAIDIDCEVAEV